MASRTRPRRWRKPGRRRTPTPRPCWRASKRRAASTTSALKMLEAAASAQPTGEAALELGLLLQRQYRQVGRGGTALQPGSQPRRVRRRIREALFRAARAAQALGRMHDANTLYRAASRSADPAVETAWGELFLETYNPPEALQSFQQVLKRDERWAPAHLGAARTLADENPPAAAAAAEQALKIDADLADAASLPRRARPRQHALRRGARADRPRARRATRRTSKRGRCSAPSPTSRDDRAAFEAEAKRVLAINPAFGEVVSRGRRSGGAQLPLRRGGRADAARGRARSRRTSAPHSDLGLHLMRTGDEAEARRVLDRDVQGVPLRSGHVQPAGAARQAREVRGRPGRRPRSSSSIRTKRRSCASTRSRSPRTR